MEEKRKKTVWEIVIECLKVTGIVTLLVTAATFLHRNYFKEPKLTYSPSVDGETITFSTAGDYRSITMEVHPQLVIKYGNTVILRVYLIGYYESESLSFSEEKKAKAVICNGEYVQKLKEYLEDGIIQTLGEVCGEAEAKENLDIYLETVGRVKYENALANQVKTKGIIISHAEEEIRDVEIDSKEMESRCCEVDLELKENLLDLEQDETVKEMKTQILDEIIKYY